MRTIVYSFFVFDLPHWGHLNHIRMARKIGDVLVVGVLDNDTVEGYKRRPIMGLEERMKIMNEVKGVDVVIPQFEKYPVETLKTLHKLFPDDKLVCVHGSDWARESFKDVDDFLQTIGGEVKLLPYYKGNSTTQLLENIKERIEKNDL